MRAGAARLTATALVALSLAACTGGGSPGSAAGPAGAAAALAAGASAASTTGYAPLSVKVVPQRMSPRAWFVQGDAGPVSRANEGFNSNAGFVVTDEGVVVFDALGSPALGAELLAQIRRITPLPVRRVIVSHYHADHFYGLQPFKAAGAEIWAHRHVRDYLASDAPAARLQERRESLAPWVDRDTVVVPPDRYLDGDTAFRLGGLTFRVLAVGPAHTAEDLMLLVEEEGVLFAGDLMFAGRVPFVGDADSRAWLASVRRLVDMKPRVVVGGHGPASVDAARDLALTRDYLAFLRAEMGRAVEQMLPFDEAYAATDWSRFRELPAFEAANRRNAYNTYLRIEQEVLGTK
jgi:glyoxylase-like metal-dependent hydrolase (beta-lactamase superfamily II)